MNKTKHIKIVGIIGLALLAALAVTLCHLPSAIFACGVALASVPLVLSEEQIKEFQAILGEMRGGWAELKALPATFKSFQDENTQLQQQMSDVRRLIAVRSNYSPRARVAGLVTDDCARHLSAHFILHCERSGKLEALASLPGQRDTLIGFAREAIGVTSKTALTTSDIPMEYGGEIRELISDFGV